MSSDPFAPYPLLAEYLKQLPAGLESYPDCKGKASIWRQFLAMSPQRSMPEGFPAVLTTLLREPPPISAWIPEAHLMALFLLEADRGGETAFMSWMRRSNKAVIESPWYSVLMKAASPAMLLKGIELRWGALHRGTGLACDALRAESARLTVSFPAGLFTPFLLKGLSTGFVAAIELAGGFDVKASLADATATSGLYDLQWTERGASRKPRGT